MSIAVEIKPTRPQTSAPITVRLAAPRGFCAGVERAIRTVEQALQRYGAPVYVRHEIVHNQHVVARLAKMGAIFIDDLEDAAPDRPVVFSAHGASIAAHREADERKLFKIDATCPLVNKVHAQARRYASSGAHVYLIGHTGHAEVVGTAGQVPEHGVTIVDCVERVSALIDRAGPKAYVTQTTLSVDDTASIIAALKARFPDIQSPRTEDICYATSNRQAAVKTIAPSTDMFVVIGSPASSNSNRMVDVALAAGATNACLIDDWRAFDFSKLDNVKSLGLSAGASAPEELVERFLEALADRFDIVVETHEITQETISFNLPHQLAS